MNTKHQDLRDRLLRQRRARHGRNGTLGPIVKALHDLATLMELSQLRIYGRGRQPTDYLLIMQACYGPLMRWDRRKGQHQIASLHTHRVERKAAEALMGEVIKALGAEYGQSIAEVRSITDRLAVDAMNRKAEAVSP